MTSRDGWQRQDGALVTEAALLLPLLFIVTFVVVHFALALWGNLVAEQAVQTGVRAMAVVGSDTGGPVVEQAGINAATEFLSSVGGITDASIDASADGRQVSLTIVGTPARVFPWTWPVHAAAAGPVERFLPITER